MSHGNKKYSIGNIVSNTEYLCMVTDGNYTYQGEHFIIYINVKSLCCTPETNIILYANCTKIEKKINIKK